MKTLLLTAALALPAQQPPVMPASPIAELARGEAAHCGAAEGCVVLTKRALALLLEQLAHEATTACDARKKGWI